MKETDIIENIQDLYNIKAPDIRGKLDFSAVEIAPPPAPKPARRYIYAAAVYAAACIVVIALLPLLIGKDSPAETYPPPGGTVGIPAGDSSDDPKLSEPVTLPRESEDAETGSDEVSVSDDVPSEEIGSAETDEPVTEPPEEGVTTPPKDPPIQTSATETKAPTDPKPVLQAKYSKYYAKRLTTKNSGVKSVLGFTCREYFDGSTPMYGITFWESRRTADSKVYFIRYNYTVDATTGKIVGKHITENDNTYKSTTFEVYHPQNSIPYGSCYFTNNGIYNVCTAVNKSFLEIKTRTELREFMDTVQNKVNYSENFNSTVYSLMSCLDSYGDEFFAENVMYIHLDVQSSCSISTVLNSISVDGNGILNFRYTEYRPNVMDCLMSGDVYIYTFAKDDLAGVRDTKVTVTSSGSVNEPGPTMSKVYPDPADSIKMRFFKDRELTDEYKSASDIPYGAKVYYKVECDPGYIRTNLKLNVLRGPQLELEWADNSWQHYYYFVFANPGGDDKLEYSCTAVLAGDSDGNRYYDMKDVETIRKYIDNDTTTRFYFGRSGYSERLDYDCNGVVNEDDITGMLEEIGGKEVTRRAPLEDFYDDGTVGSNTHLLKIDSAVVLPRGDVYVETEYAIYKDRPSIVRLPKEVYEKYDDYFFVHYDLAVLYCFTKDEAVPDVSDLKDLWCIDSGHTATLTPVYRSEIGSITNKYAIYVAVPKYKKIEAIIPV